MGIVLVAGGESKKTREEQEDGMKNRRNAVTMSSFVFHFKEKALV